MRVDHLDDVQLALRPHRVRGPVMAAFLEVAAIQPAAAIRFAPATPSAKAAFARMLVDRVLVPTGSGHWLDLRRHYAVEHARSTRRAAIGVVVALAVAATAVLFYQG